MEEDISISQMTIPSPLLSAVYEEGRVYISLASCHHLHCPAAAWWWAHICSGGILCVSDMILFKRCHWNQACGDIRTALRIKFWSALCELHHKSPCNGSYTASWKCIRGVDVETQMCLWCSWKRHKSPRWEQLAKLNKKLASCQQRATIYSICTDTLNCRYSLSLNFFESLNYLNFEYLFNWNNVFVTSSIVLAQCHVLDVSVKYPLQLHKNLQF